MKRKIALTLLSATLLASAFLGTISVMAENDSLEKDKTEYSFKQASRGTMEIGKITDISDNTITVVLAEKPEKLNKDEKSIKPPTDNDTETPKEPELKLTDKTITIDVTDVKIRTETSDESDISALSVDTVVRLLYNEDNKLIEISSGKFVKKDKFDDKICKVGKITEVSGNNITVVLAERPEKPNKDEKNIEPPKDDNTEAHKEPEMNFSEETITINITDSVKIRTEASDESDISALSVDTVVRLIYNEDNELIEISSGRFGRKHAPKGFRKDKNSNTESTTEI